MLNIKSDEIFQSNSSYSKYKCVFKTLAKIFLGYKGTTGYVYDFQYEGDYRNWDNLPNGNIYREILAKNEKTYFDLLAEAGNNMGNWFLIPKDQPDDDSVPFWHNQAFPPFDAAITYLLINKFRPAVYLEVGSGNSTKFARRAIDDNHLKTRIVSIEPFPAPYLDKVCHNVIKSKLEDVPLDFFASLKSGDMLFIDNSHRSFQGSDVTCFFTEILPLLNKGVIWGIHDTFLPYDYPETWKWRFYNEQYLLMAYLLGGASGDEVLFPVAYMSGHNEIDDAFLGQQKDSPPWNVHQLHGGSFWMVKN